VCGRGRGSKNSESLMKTYSKKVPGWKEDDLGGNN
jgi:hypothetical protein